MSVADIEKAVAKLSPEEFSKFRAWFEELAADRWDEQIARDAKGGKLDKLADEALAEHKAGKTREL